MGLADVKSSNTKLFRNACFFDSAGLKTGHAELVHTNKIMANYSVSFNSSTNLI